MKSLFAPVFDVMSKALSLRTKKNSLIASNLANVDTPGYKSKDLNFRGLMETYLEEKGLSKKRNIEEEVVLHTTNPKHLKPKEDYSKDFIIENQERGVPNNVDLDEQMAKLSENNIQYQIVTQMLVKKFELLKTAITEGGKQ